MHCQVTLNGAFEAPSPETWLLLDPDSGQASFEQLVLAEALVLGRKTGRRAPDQPEGLAIR